MERYIDTPEVDDEVEDASVSSSLEARMARRRDEVESNVTEKFPLPGKFSDIIAVELRMLEWKTLQAIANKHRKMREESTRLLYVACDQLIRATEGFYEMVADDEAEDGVRYRPIAGETYERCARRGVADLPEDLTARQALLALVRPDSLVMIWWQEWQEWMRDRRPETDEEVMRDFSTTG